MSCPMLLADLTVHDRSQHMAGNPGTETFPDKEGDKSQLPEGQDPGRPMGASEMSFSGFS